ncbi:hypothetical protein AB0269_02730 [Microbacterium sp. NPDC077644]|uniref:hypothetical protein n=1 Tax=Microbacterium sp. NPDC077644 TaxID=3155055 RepID=UPI00344F172E
MRPLRQLVPARFRRADGEQPPPAVIYLVSAAGHPSFGDELITRAWLDVLTELRPEAEVWLDCPYPGRASHLFRRTHPGLHVTSTLWELAASCPSPADPIADAERVARFVRDLGTPRIDPGLLALRGVANVHILGGGLFAAAGVESLGIISAVAELQRAFGIPASVTGLCLPPMDRELSTWVTGELDVFDVVEARDRVTAEAVGGELGLDDAFLALAVGRRVYDESTAPEHVVLVQGDARTWTDGDAIRSIESFFGDTPHEVAAFVEATPPDDARYIADTAPEARFYSFGNIWFDGLPARAGQRWLTTRFHAHLLAAAAGAMGTVIIDADGADDRTHSSLLDLGTGWNAIRAGEQAAPAADPDFPARAREHAATKRALAVAMYARVDD